MTGKHIRLVALLIGSTLISPSRVEAQAVSGSITGAVLDPSGAGIPRAEVTVTNTETAVPITVTSNAAGYYTASNLISGNYKVDVTATGFKKFEQGNVAVTIGSVVRLDLTLVLGNTQDTVIITAEAPLVVDDRVNLGGTVSQQQLHSLPTLGRNPTALNKLQAGIIESPGQSGIPSAQTSASYQVVANGQRGQLNSFLLDGVDDTEGVGGAAPLVPTVDALQEYSVSTTNYDVEFGQVAGAVQIMTTKSGTNGWHGSGYEYNRVNALFARNPFSEPKGSGHFVYNQYGGTIGGPILKNKLFFFSNYQGVKVRSGGNILTTVPTAAFRNGDFSSLPDHPIFDPLTGGPLGVGRTQFPGNRIPANRLDPSVQKLLTLMPLPNRPGSDNNFTAPNVAPINQQTGTVRGDYALNDANRFFVRYTHQNGDSTSAVPAFGKAVWPNGSVQNGNNQSLSADYTRVISPALIFEGRFGWTQTEWKQDAVDQASKTSTELGFAGLNDACPSCGGLAGFSIGGPVGAFSVGNNFHAHQVDNYGGYNFVGIATWTKSAHTIKFGTDMNFSWRDRRDSSSQGNYGSGNNQGASDQGITGSADVAGSGIGVASFLLGKTGFFTRNIYAHDLPLAKQNRAAIYVQDTWRATRKLTLNLGLRWDYIGYPTSPQPGGIINLNFSNAYTIISNFGKTSATANVENNYHDFGPRLGLAYRIREKTVIRAGAARTYSLGFFGANFGAITNTWPSATRQTVIQDSPYDPIFSFSQGPPPFVSGYDVLAAAGNPGQYPTPTDSTGFGTDSHNPTHSVDQWNFAIQHQLTNDVVFTIAYVGNAGRHLFYRRDYNAALPGPGSFSSRKPYAPLGYTLNMYNQSNQSSSGYHGLQFQAEKRYGQGFLVTTALTWSKSYDFGLHNASYPFNANLDRAPQDTDRALVFSVGHVWDLPFGPGKKLLKSNGPSRFIVGGWQFSGITRYMSGTPFTPVMGDRSSLNSDCCTLRPDRNGSGTVSNPTRDGWFNPAAFSRPAQYMFGNSGRNILRGPNFIKADWSLTKSILITEQKRLELHWELFNAFNRTNLGGPNSAIDASTAGGIFSLADPMRRQQLGIHFVF